MSHEGGYSFEEKQLAYKLDPEPWVSYSGKPRAFKSSIEKRRTATLKEARKSIYHEKIQQGMAKAETQAFALYSCDLCGQDDMDSHAFAQHFLVCPVAARLREKKDSLTLRVNLRIRQWPEVQP